MVSPLIISLEGNIGIGKSTLLDNLEKYYDDKNVIFLREPVDEWMKIKDSSGISILSHFYLDPQKYGCSFQLVVLKTMYELLSNTIKENLNCELIICERSVLSSYHVFAKMMLNEIEFKIFESFYSQYNSLVPHKVIYLDTSAKICSQRIEKRNREGEQNIDLVYLKKCEKYHHEWLNTLSQTETDILIINIDSNINYDLDDDDNIGLKWIKQIEAFATK